MVTAFCRQDEKGARAVQVFRFLIDLVAIAPEKLAGNDC